MKIEYLRYLLEIDKQHTISTAAKNLYMGQTTLSSIVKSVEDELGYAVFQRTPKGVVPTHNGEQLLEAARSIVKMYDKVLAIKDGNALPYQMPLLLAPSLAVDLPLELNKHLCQVAENCMLYVHTMARNRIIPQIIEKTASLGVTYLYMHELQEKIDSAAKYHVTVEPLRKDSFFLVTSRRHELSGRKSVSLKDLTSYRYTSTSNFNLGGSERILGSFYHVNQRRTVFPTIDLLCKALLRQDYIAFLPGNIFEKVIDKNLYSVIRLDDVDSPNEMWICSVYREKKELRYAENEALQFIENYFREMDLFES